MAVKRTVGCPHCGAHKETKAAPRMRLRCASCGKPFRAPDVTDDLPPATTPVEPAVADAAGESTETPPSARGDVVPPASSGGVSVARARPRVGAPAAADVDVDEGQADVEPDDGQSPAQRRARGSRLTQRAGRKGGKASAAKRASVPAAGAYARSTGRA